MFDIVYIDITAGCNAKCPLCQTARESFGQRLQFMPVANFARTLDRLLEIKLATAGKTMVRLFNWGEPILHPDLDGILKALGERDLRAGFSTNASKATTFTVSTAHFGEMTFSVPGWSQASYDKVHGLSFKHVIANMQATIKNMRATGYRGDFLLSYHVYQFNAFAELEAARAWCQSNGVKFFPYYAYINDFTRARAFLKGELPPKEVAELSETLFLHYVKDTIARQTPDWKCPMWASDIVLTHRSDVLLCCGVPETLPGAKLGSIFTMTREEVLTRKSTHSECNECMGCGQAYWATHFEPIPLPPTPTRRLVAYLKADTTPRPLRAIVPIARAARNALRQLGVSAS